MKTTRSINSSLIFILLLAAGCAEVNPPSEALNDYIERPEIDQELGELYFYPTTVRMLDKFISNGEGGILEGVKEGRLFFAKSDSLDILQRDVKELENGLRSEGFELLAEFKSGDMSTVAYVRDQTIDRYVVLVGGDGVATMLIEMKGEISLETIQGLSDLNTDNVMSLLDLARGNNEELIDESESEEAEPDTTKTKTIKIEI
ncbi:MAG: hypothetical protein ACI8QH_000991 [Flammeovirgaceae bacterium]|jgi:hypothetical protein